MRAVDVGDEVHARAAAAIGRQRRVAIAGPRSEPPMPMLTTSLNVSPATPRISPERTWSAKPRNRSSVACTSGMTFIAVDADVGVARRTQRDVQDGAVLGDVDRLAGEHLHRAAPSTSAASASVSSSCIVSATMRFFE